MSNQIGKSSSGAVVVVGGGISGLVAGCLLARSGARGPIYIVERADEPGGLLRSFDGGAFGRFDHGMHTFTSANLPELDDLILGLMPRDEWIMLAGKQRDISGVFFQGKLQRACHYPDLRALPEPSRRETIADFCLNLGKAEKPSPTLAGFFNERFGAQTTRNVFAPILEKLYGVPGEELDPIVAKIFPLDRIALYEEEGFAGLMDSARLRARVAYPEQRNLDLKYASTRYSLYPKQYGAFRLIDALLARLSEAGVTVLTGTTLEAIEVAERKIISVRLKRGDKTIALDSPRQVIWTAGFPMLGRLLGFKAASTPFESRRTSAVANLLLDRPADLGDLYYFWNWDAAFKSYRVTNYAGYCPDAPRAGGFPIGFEFVLPADQKPDVVALSVLAEGELKDMGLFPEGAKVLYSIGGILPVGFPAFSLKNRRLLEQYRTEFGALQISNLAVTGIQVEWGVIYQPEVLSHTFLTVNDALARVE